MVVARDVVGAGAGGNTNQLTWLHTASGSDRHVLIGIRMTTGTITSVTYGAITCSLVAGTLQVEADNISAIYEPDSEVPTTAQTVTVNFSAMSHCQANSFSWTGVDQTTPTDNGGGSTGTATSVSNDVESPADDYAFDHVGTEATVTVGSGQNLEWDITQAAHHGAASTEDGSGTTTMSWTFGVSTGFAHSVCNVRAAVGGQTVAVGVLPETDALIPIAAVKPIIVGIGTLAETNALISVQARKVATIGVLAEVESLISIQARKLAAIGVLGETDALIPVVPVKPIITAVGVLGEVDALISVQARKIANIGTLAEVNNLISIAAIKVANIGTIAETDALIPIAVILGGGQTIAVGTIAEVDSLVSIAARKIANVGTLAESDSLIPITISKVAPIGTLGESDGLISIQAVKTATIGTLAQVDALIPVVPVKPIIEGVGTVAESDLLIGIQARKVARIGTVAETDSLIPIVPVKPISVNVGTLAEVDVLIAIAVIIVGVGWWKKDPTGFTKNPTGFTKIKSTDPSPW